MQNIRLERSTFSDKKQLLFVSSFFWPNKQECLFFPPGSFQICFKFNNLKIFLKICFVFFLRQRFSEFQNWKGYIKPDLSPFPHTQKCNNGPERGKKITWDHTLVGRSPESKNALGFLSITQILWPWHDHVLLRISLPPVSSYLLVLLHFYCLCYYRCPHSPPPLPTFPNSLAVTTWLSVSVGHACLLFGQSLHLLSSSPPPCISLDTVSSL